MDIVERHLLEQLEKAIKDTKRITTGGEGSIGEEKPTTTGGEGGVGEEQPTTTRGEGGTGEIKHTSFTILRMPKIRKDCEGLKDKFKTMVDGGSVDARIKENLYYLVNVMTEWRRLSDEHCFSEATLHSVQKLRGILKQVEEVVQELEKEKEEKEKEEKEKEDPEVYRWSCRSVDLNKIYGIEDHDRVMERLLVKEGSFKTIGIVGMAGIGKTTLCQKVFENEQVKNHFLPRIWVCLSKQPHVQDYKKELVKMILTGLGFERKIIDKIGEDGLSRLLLALRLQLKRQPYLIVLDDAWNTEKDFKSFCTSLARDNEEQDQLHYGLPKGHGGAVIVTGRSPIMIASMVGEENLHSMPLADAETCWKIFRDAAEKDGKIEGEPEEGGDVFQREIVRKCAGLPLTAKILGQVQHGN